MRNLLIIAALLVVAFMAGWFTVHRDGEHTTIRFNRDEIRQDTRAAIAKGRDFIDRAQQENGQGDFQSQNFGNPQFGNAGFGEATGYVDTGGGGVQGYSAGYQMPESGNAVPPQAGNYSNTPGGYSNQPGNYSAGGYPNENFRNDGYSDAYTPPRGGDNYVPPRYEGGRGF